MYAPHAKAWMDCRFDTRTAFPNIGMLDVDFPITAVAETNGDWRAFAQTTFSPPKWLTSENVLIHASMDSKSFTLYGKLVVSGTKLIEIGDQPIILHTYEAIGYCPWKIGKFKKAGAGTKAKDIDKISAGESTRVAIGLDGKKDKRAYLKAKLRGLFSGMLLIAGTYGSDKVHIQGLAAFGSEICVAMRFARPFSIIKTILGFMFMTVDSTTKPLILSWCFDAVEFKDLSDIYKVVRSDTKGLGFETGAKGEMADASWLLAHLPAEVPTGFSLMFSVRLREQAHPGFNIYSLAKLGGFYTADKKNDIMFNVQIVYYHQDGSWNIKVNMNRIDLRIGGSVRESWFTPGVEVMWDEKKLKKKAPDVFITGKIEMKIEIDKTNYVHFEGTVKAGKSFTASLKLKAPTVLPVFSKHLALVSTSGYPIQLSVGWDYLKKKVSAGFGGGFIISPPRGRGQDSSIQLQSGAGDGDRELQKCNAKASCYSIQFSFALEIQIVTKKPLGVELNIRAAPADITPIDMIAALLGSPLATSAADAMKTLMPVRPKLLAIDFQYEEHSSCSIGVGLVATVPLFNAWLMTSLQFSFSGVVPVLKFSIIVNKFCLGLTISGDCYGVQIAATTQGNKKWKTIKADFVKVWNGEMRHDGAKQESWSDSLLTSYAAPMSSGTNMGPYIIFDLAQGKFSMAATGKVTIAGYNLVTVSVQCEVSPKRFWYKAEANFLGGSIKMSIELDVSIQPLSLTKYQFIMDFSAIFANIKSGAKSAISAVSSFAWWVVDSLGIFDMFRIGANSLTVTSRLVSLSIDITIFFEISVRMTINYGWLLDIFSAKFSKIVKEALNSLVRKVRNFSPCDCVDSFRAGGNERTWGLYIATSSGYSFIPCGASSRWVSKYGSSFQCGAWVAWCGGRRRWWTPSWPCGGGWRNCWYSTWVISTLHCSWSYPWTGYHWDYRRRFCNTVSYCTLPARKMKYQR